MADPSSYKLKVETVARGLRNPWSLAFLPAGFLLVTERPGRLRIISPRGQVGAPVGGLPRIAARGQGGLLDVQLSPRFADDQTIFFSFSEPRGRGRNGTSVARARLVRDGAEALTAKLTDLRIIFRQKPDYRSSAHFGSRLVFARDGTLFVTLGDRYSLKDEAQNPANHIGKLVRINQDGSAPADNPRKPGWAPEIYSIGHRNVQGAARHPATGRLYTIEHGAAGGDEINRPEPGKNYGWPVITYGRDYSGAKIGIGTRKTGMEQPLYYWDPSIAPSGAAFYTGSLFPAWKGDLFIGALASRLVARMRMRDGKIESEERLLEDLGERIRDVRDGPDGALWLLSDRADGRVLRVVPG
ncbi:MAG: PQQ-dependent sugar dehydrogenase [Pseudomonadota bacterium]